MAKTNKLKWILIIALAFICAQCARPTPTGEVIPTKAPIQVETATATDMPPEPTNTSTAVPPSLTPDPKPPYSCIPDKEPVEAKVVRIIDGDTIEVHVVGSVESVRLIGIDTPEKGEAGFTEASSFTEKLVDGKDVLLWQDVSDRDRYDRLLAYVTFDNSFLNLRLVQSGHAVPYPYPPDTSCANLFDSEHKPPTPTKKPVVIVPTRTKAVVVSPCENKVFANCTAVRAAGCAPVYSHQSWYRSKFDRDKDGIGCE